MIDPASTLGELVAERAARAAVFERLHLDYCCGGDQTLLEACGRHGLQVDTVQAELEALDAADDEPRGSEERDWRHASVAELCAHIVAVHHDGLREAFPRIEALLATVVRVHGAGHPTLRTLQRSFGQLRRELEPHLHREEESLFPACAALERNGAAVDETLISEHEHEHADVGGRLAELRALADDYQPGRALCNTHRALLEQLAAFELDLHQHIHEENNVLIPRVRKLGSAGTQSASLPRCCQAWIVEQTRTWSPHRR